MGTSPTAVAVDGRTGRVVVVDMGGTVRAPLGWAERWRRQVAGWAPWLGWRAPRAPDVAQVPGDVLVIDPGA